MTVFVLGFYQPAMQFNSLGSCNFMYKVEFTAQLNGFKLILVQNPRKLLSSSVSGTKVPEMGHLSEGPDVCGPYTNFIHFDI